MSLAPREEASALGLQWRVYEKVGLLVAKLNLQMPNTTLQGYDYRYRHAKHLDVQVLITYQDTAASRPRKWDLGGHGLLEHR